MSKKNKDDYGEIKYDPKDDPTRFSIQTCHERLIENGKYSWNKQCAMAEDVKFKALYNEKVQYLGNPIGGSYLNYQKQGENQS